MTELPELTTLIRQGDALETLPLLHEQLGPSQLIYVDPPFNAGGTRRARLGTGSRAAGIAAYIDVWGGLDGFLEMLGARLRVMYETLADTGSLWLHLDHRAVHDAKVVADSIFGRGNFQGEVIWVPGNGGKRRNGPSVTHQTILIYGKSKQMLYNIEDPALREPYAKTSLQMHFTHIDADGRRFRERVIAGKTYRYYADRGRKIGSVWADCPAMAANTPLRKETTGYPTQKPESLLERIIRAASAPGDLVVDPMCGSGTTCVTAARLGRRFGGGDVNPDAVRIARGRIVAERGSPSP